MFRGDCRLHDERVEEQRGEGCAIPDSWHLVVQYRMGPKVNIVNSADKRPRDRRVQRTRTLLHEALGSLLGESPYDAITVTDILERADVGRSTFYTHFHNKDELLVSAMRELLGSIRLAPAVSQTRSARLTGFGLPLLEHIHRHRHGSVVKKDPRKWADVHGHLRAVVGDMLTSDLKRNADTRPKLGLALPPDLVGKHIASTFILVLNWWLESRNELLPDEVNELFNALILPKQDDLGARPHFG